MTFTNQDLDLKIMFMQTHNLMMQLEINARNSLPILKRLTTMLIGLNL